MQLLNVIDTFHCRYNILSAGAVVDISILWLQ